MTATGRPYGSSQPEGCVKKKKKKKKKSKQDEEGDKRGRRSVEKSQAGGRVRLRKI